MTNSLLPKIDGNFKGKDILDASQFSQKDIDIIFKSADKMKNEVSQNGGLAILQQKIMAPLFYEPSSRTFSSFSAAMLRLGGSVIPLSNMGATSVIKGESFDDTVQVFSSYSDVLVIRHPEVGSVAKAADISPIPVINAGDGIGEHPTQGLLDIYTINEILQKIDGLHVVFFGELARYRPVNSLAKILALYPNNKMTFVSPKEVSLQPAVKTYLQERNVQVTEQQTLDNAIEDADILYVTRVKKEFMPDELYNKISGKYIVDMSTVNKMKKNSMIMHPLPRIDEIAKEVDEDPRAVYLKTQVKNGMYVRMALLALVLGRA